MQKEKTAKAIKAILIIATLNACLSVKLAAQFLITGSNLYSTANFITSGTDSSSFVVGNFLTYEIVTGGASRNIVQDYLEIEDSLAFTDSCGVEHYTNKLYVAHISKTGTVDWIQVSKLCESTESFSVVDITTDSENNAYILGVYNTNMDLAQTQVATNGEWDMFLFKLDNDGNVLWALSGNTLSSSSGVIPSDIEIAGNAIFISGEHYGSTTFVGEIFSSQEKQFFLLELDTNGNETAITSGVPLYPSTTSSLHTIDNFTNGSIAGFLSAEDSLLISRKSIGGILETIDTLSGFNIDVLYNIDSINIAGVTSVVDSFLIGTNPGIKYYRVYYDSIINKSLATDSVYVADTSARAMHSYFTILNSNIISFESEINAVPNDFLIDQTNSDAMYGMYNYSSNIILGADTIIPLTQASVALVKYTPNIGIDWYKTGYSTTDSVTGTRIATDNSSNLYLAGSVGRESGSHILIFDGTAYPQSKDEDAFIVKLTGEAVQWGQMLGDSASDRINDIYALDEFNIFAAGEYSRKIEIEYRSIETSASRDMFAATIDPFPEFDLNVSSSSAESEILCHGDSVVLTATSSHNCTFQWMKDGTPINGATGAELWVKESGTYSMKATSESIVHENGSPFAKLSKEQVLSFNPLPANSITVDSLLAFCQGGQTYLQISLKTSDTCSWHELNTGFIEDQPALSVTETGEYYAIIESQSGCISYSDTIFIEVYESPSDSIAILDASNAFCTGDSISIESFDEGTNLYIWYKDTDSLTTVTSPRISFKEEGEYYVDIVSDNHCVSRSDTLVLAEVTAPNLTQQFADEETGICEGDSSQIRLSSHSDTKYTWFFNNDTISGEQSNLIHIKEAGNYHAVVTKSDVCIRFTDTFTLVVNSNPTASISIDGDSVICSNETTALSIQASPGVNYIWYRNGDTLYNETSASIAISDAGTYFAKVQNSFGCIASVRSVPIVVKSAPNIQLISENNRTEFCSNDSLRLYLENNQGYAFQWKRNSTNFTNSAQQWYAKQSGTYTIDIFDNGTECSSSTNAIEITSLNLPDNTLLYDIQTPLCNRDTVVLSTSTPTGTFEWYKNNQLLLIDTLSTLKAYNNGTYSLTLTDENNCSVSTNAVQLTFLDNDIPPIQQDVKYLSTLLYNELQWMKNSSPIPNATEQVYLVEESGLYNVEVTHENGCVAKSKSIKVCVPFPILSVEKNVITAAEGLAYQWFFENDTIFGANNISYIAQLSGSYSVDIEQAGNCISRSEPVNVCYPVPEIELQPNNVMKSTLGLEYQWYLNNNPIVGSDARLYVFSEPGNYKVQVTNLDGCTAFSDPVSVSLTSIANLDVPFTIHPNPFENSLSIEFTTGTGTDEITFQLQNVLGKTEFASVLTPHSQTFSLPELPSGLYTATVTIDEVRYRISVVKM